MPDRLTVTAPASSANLGPGFDCLAVALELRNRVEITAGGGDVSVSVEGEGASRVPRDGSNLFVRAFASVGADPAGLAFAMQNAVPFARGLGSSAATIAAGVAAGLAWQGLYAEDALPSAAALEGHPDNVAAALLGGITLAWTATGGARALRLSGCPVEFVAVVAAEELATERARAALPAQVGHADAVHTAARAALLVAALEQGRTDALADALDDRLHEPFRAPLVPLLQAVRERLPGLPAFGATLSGAGPSVLVWCEPGAAKAVSVALGDVDGRALPLRVAERGVTLD